MTDPRKSQAPRPAVVLVHGAYADGSSWSGVIERLQRAGLTAAAVQNPLTSLADDVAHTRRILALHHRPVILTGHSFAGIVISEAGTDPRVAGLVYIAARAPDAHEDYAALAQKFPAPPANAGLVYTGGFGGLTEDAFLNDFANGVDRVRARVLYAAQGRVSESLFHERPQRRPGGRNERGTPSRGRTVRSRWTCSASSPNACRPRRSRSTRAISR